MQLSCPVAPHALQVVGQGWGVGNNAHEFTVGNGTGGLDTVPLPLQVEQTEEVLPNSFKDGARPHPVTPDEEAQC